jgi:hypothetical protein
MIRMIIQCVYQKLLGIPLLARIKMENPPSTIPMNVADIPPAVLRDVHFMEIAMELL